jgi:hypothetical protein
VYMRTDQTRLRDLFMTSGADPPRGISVGVRTATASTADTVAEVRVTISSVAAGLGARCRRRRGIRRRVRAREHGGRESFFTPWHAALYRSLAVLAGWILGSTWLGHRREGSWRDAVPAGYGGGLLGIGTFAVGGVLDMAWHQAFGIEAGIDAS